MQIYILQIDHIIVSGPLLNGFVEVMSLRVVSTLLYMLLYVETPESTLGWGEGIAK